MKIYYIYIYLYINIYILYIYYYYYSLKIYNLFKNAFFQSMVQDSIRNIVYYFK